MLGGVLVNGRAKWVYSGSGTPIPGHMRGVLELDASVNLTGARG
jgi:hypothetical protein